MVIRLHNTAKWRVLEPAEVLKLAGGEHRRVRIAVNCEAATRFDLFDGEPDKPGKMTMLAAGVVGQQVLEFACRGDAFVSVQSEGEVWYFTDEGDVTSFSNPEAKSFTTIANRRVRNPELELMMWRAEQNMKRRLEKLERESLARIAAAAGADNDGVLPDDEDGHGDDTGTTGGAVGANGGHAPAGEGEGETAGKAG